MIKSIIKRSKKLYLVTFPTIWSATADVEILSLYSILVPLLQLDSRVLRIERMKDCGFPVNLQLLEAGFLFVVLYDRANYYPLTI